MATRNNKRTLITKMLLKDALIELMETKDINHITIKEICESAELNRSTFYLHYQDQYALLEEIEKELVEKTLGFVQETYDNSDSMSLVKSLLDNIKENAKIFKILLCIQENSSFKNQFIQIIKNQVISNVQLSELTADESYMYAFIMDGCMKCITTWIENDFDLSSERLAMIIYHLCDSVIENSTSILE